MTRVYLLVCLCSFKYIFLNLKTQSFPFQCQPWSQNSCYLDFSNKYPWIKFLGSVKVTLLMVHQWNVCFVFRTIWNRNGKTYLNHSTMFWNCFCFADEGKVHVGLLYQLIWGPQISESTETHPHGLSGKLCPPYTFYDLKTSFLVFPQLSKCPPEDDRALKIHQFPYPQGFPERSPCG